MNTTLPAPRDLPPRRRAQIRAELERVVVGRRLRSRWVVPVAAAATTVAAVAVAVVVAPWGGQERGGAPAAPPATSSQPPPPSVAPPVRPVPEFPGLPPAERAAIERNCARSVGAGKATLYNLVEDAAGRAALLYTETGSAPQCDVDDPKTPYNASGGSAQSMSWLAGPVSMDGVGASSGGDVFPNSGPYAGYPGLETITGRVSAEVARVTVTSRGTTQDANLANGTYLARIVRPSTWSIPDDNALPVVRAYDATGALLGTALAPNYRGPSCYLTPDGTILPVNSTGDPQTCEPAVPWQ